MQMPYLCTEQLRSAVHKLGGRTSQTTTNPISAQWHRTMVQCNKDAQHAGHVHTTLHCYSFTLMRMPCSFSSPNSTRNSCSCRRKANQALVGSTTNRSHDNVQDG